MTCKDLSLALSAYFDAILPLEQFRAIHRHLAECDDCLAYCIRYQRVVLLLHQEQDFLRQTR